MKKKLFGTILVFLFLMSCSSENDFLSESSVLPESSVLTKSAQNTEVELASVVHLLVEMNLDVDLMKEVKQVVDHSIYYGQDETCRFKDLLMPDSSKIFRTFATSRLMQRMGERLNSFQYSLTKESLFDYLSRNNIQIYWPYSESWDMKNTPVITSYCDDGKEWSYGYKVTRENETVKIDTIIVDSNYLKNNTVWVINQNQTSYEELPNFENGEYIKNGTLFFSEAFKKNQKEVSNYGMLTEGVFIGYINSLNNHDGGLAGGPEFKFLWGHLAFSKGSVNSYSFKLTQSEVGHSKEINICIQPAWDFTQLTNCLVVLEKDGGKDKTMTRMLTQDVGGGTTIPVIIPYEANDDILFDQILYKSDIFSDKNKPFGQWKQYQGDDFWFTLPTKYI